MITEAEIQPLWATRIEDTPSLLWKSRLEISVIGIKRKIGSVANKYHRTPIEETELRMKYKEDMKKLRTIRDELRAQIK